MPPSVFGCVSHTDGNRLSPNVYLSEGDTDRVLNFSSSHSSNAKSAVVRTLIGRIETHFADGDPDVNGRDLETAHIYEVRRANDYPERFIERVVRRMKQPATSEPGSVSSGQVSSDCGSVSNKQVSSDSGSMSNEQASSESGSVSNDQTSSDAVRVQRGSVFKLWVSDRPS